MMLDLQFDAGFCRLTLNRPERLNALSFELLAELRSALESVRTSGARALIVTGAGERAFCAGADIEELRDRALVAQREGARMGQAVFQALADLPLVSIAAINGYAFGGGLELALACTFRIAGPRARLGLPEIKLGLIPGYGGTQRLPRLVGPSKALDIILTGRTLEAEEAHGIGLVDRIAPEPLAAAHDIAAQLAGFSLPVLHLAREAVLRGSSLSLAEGLQLEADLSTLAYQTADAREGLAAFLEKRPPEFRDG
jgi:enoyl-CoA hydratase